MSHNQAISNNSPLAINALIKVRIKIGKNGDKLILRSECGKVGFITNLIKVGGKIQAGQDWCCQVLQDGPTYFKGSLMQQL